MANDKEIALYYPYIDIDDASLIKTAALYWDEIQTIIPLNYDNPYKTETSQTAYKEGFLKKREVRWDDEEIEKAGKEFVADLRNDNVLATLKKISQVKNMPRYTNLNVNKIGLENNQFIVTTFNDPVEALSRFKPGLYDLMIIDIRMPGMNGFQLYHKIRHIDHKVKVCFLTAFEEARGEF